MNLFQFTFCFLVKILEKTNEPRKKNIKQNFPSNQSGLEIGPLANPIVTKCESQERVKYIDYADAEFLRKIIRMQKVLILTTLLILITYG